ncbi:DUF1499 domain-containing protein [candidate division CSSED10-310 bacterium]|uniref:DUF1499 domain-containing protein n=1 Tax=candidate division CSSED10-310 bacterium TaxID=2855610 RepID=A0ABV6Z375_UNCC1
MSRAYLSRSSLPEGGGPVYAKTRFTSRIGQSDLGVNRERVETIRKLFHDRMARD